MAQHIPNNATVTGVERPTDPAKVVERSPGQVCQMSLANAQSAIA